MDELKKNRSREKLEQAQKALAAMREQLKGPAWQPASATPEDKARAGVCRGGQGVVDRDESAGDGDFSAGQQGQIEIQVGNTKVKIAPENLEKVKGSG